jgi:hypothetical protein
MRSGYVATRAIRAGLSRSGSFAFSRAVQYGQRQEPSLAVVQPGR